MPQRNEYIFQNALPLTFYLKGGKSTTISLSMGGDHLGFTLQYLNDRFDVDIDKTIIKHPSILRLELPYTGHKRLQSTGFLIGPYIGSNFGKKNKFRAEMIPAIGMISTRGPKLKISYDNGGFSFPNDEIRTQFIYSLALRADYAFAGGFSIGTIWRGTLNDTLYSYLETSSNFLISLTYRQPL